MPVYEFEKDFSDKEKVLFEEVWKYVGNKYPAKYFRFVETWRFVLKVQPNIMYWTQLMDVDLERQKAELDKFFNHKRTVRLDRLKDYHRYYWPLWNDKYVQMTLNKDPRETEGFLCTVFRTCDMSGFAKWWHV